MRLLDLVIIAAYVAAILGIGFWCRKRQKTTRHYFLAGRHLPWWAISGSIVATETSAITFVSDLPTTSTDKVDYQGLKRLAAADAGR